MKGGGGGRGGGGGGRSRGGANVIGGSGGTNKNGGGRVEVVDVVGKAGSMLTLVVWIGGLVGLGSMV